MSDAQGRGLVARQEFEAQLNEQVQNFKALLPSHIPVEKFKRVVVVAIAQNPDLFRADRRSLFMSAQKCAADGLLPDGRQAALVIYNTKMKVKLDDDSTEERWVPAVQYMPMVAGIRQRMRNSGEVLSAEAHVVYRNDEFYQEFGDNSAITHKPPALGGDRGDPVGAYAIIKLKNGEVLRETMDKQQIDAVRAISKSKDGPAWKNFWGEMARKVVLRRCAKAAPTSADIDLMLSRDDDEPSGMPMVDITPAEPEPPRGAAITHAPEPQPEGLGIGVIDCDGEEHLFATLMAAEEFLQEVLADAARRGPKHVEAARENNAALLPDFSEVHPNSPAGDNGNPADQTLSSRKGVGGQDRPAPDPSNPPPAGEPEMDDMLGGPMRQPASHRFDLPRQPNWGAFSDWIDAQLDAGVTGRALRADNHHALHALKLADPDLYDAVQGRLGK